MLLRKKRSIYGTTVFAVLILVPVVLWVSHMGVGKLAENPGRFLMAIGKLCAFVGLAAYSLNPVLSMRHTLFEKLFGGLDSLYKLHKQSGKVSFFFILGHPLFLAIGGLLLGKSVFTVWNWASLTVLVGIFGLVALTALTALSIYSHIKHQKWIIVHRLFGWLIPVLFAHALLARAQLSQNPPLLFYMTMLGSLGITAFLYRSVFGFLVKRYRYVVAEVNSITPAVTELVLKPLGVPLNYRPGQFAYLAVESDAIDREAHPFSFTTANNGPYVRFVIKELGDDTANIKHIKPGSKAYLEGPYGNFTLNSTPSISQVWIAGGVGITPFLSMARSFTKDSKHKIHLFYASDKLDDAVFLKELMAVQKTIPDNLEVTLVNREWSGFVTMELLEKYIEDFSKDDYFICGPPMMMHALRGALVKKGVKPSRIFIEEFSV